MENNLLPNPHAGEILRQEFLEELKIKDKDLSLAIDISPRVIENIIQGKLSINADIDLRLSRYFGLSEGYFLRLQNAYDLMEARRRLGEDLNHIVPLTIG
jgi:addiction module HigA family antidote